MNLILVEETDVSPTGRAALSERHVRHLANVLHKCDGDIVSIGIVNGRKGYGQLKGEPSAGGAAIYVQLLPVEIHDRDAALKAVGLYDANFVAVRYEPQAPARAQRAAATAAQAADLSAPQRAAWLDADLCAAMAEQRGEAGVFEECCAFCNIHVCYALVAPTVMHRIAKAAGTFGFASVQFFKSAKSEAGYWTAKSAAQTQLESSVRFGLEQGCLTRETAISKAESLDAALERFANVRETAAFALLHPRSTSQLAAQSLQEFCRVRRGAREVVLIFGPAGGFTDEEVERVCARPRQDVALVTLDAPVLTCEQALIYTCGQLSCLLGARRTLPHGGQR